MLNLNDVYLVWYDESAQIHRLGFDYLAIALPIEGIQTYASVWQHKHLYAYPNSH